MPLLQPHRRVALVLALSVCAISTAAILVRLVPSMHPISIAFWRTAIVAALLAPTLVKPGVDKPRGRTLLWTTLAGLCLALHFWAWFASLQHTTVMRSTVLVCLTPVWAGFLAWTVFRQPPGRRFWLGIAVALLGVWIMAASGSAEGRPVSWLGDGLAIAGGMLAGVYLTIGRAIRPSVALGPYGALLCATCAGWLFIAAVGMEAALPPPDLRAWLVLGAMALGPQLMGHIGFNYAVRFVPAFVVGAVVLLEPVGATALATVVLDEWPSLREVLGAVVIVLGVIIATLTDRR